MCMQEIRLLRSILGTMTYFDILTLILQIIGKNEEGWHKILLLRMIVIHVNICMHAN